MVESGYRQLIVMRHAKTEQSASSDRARDLTSRGRGDAHSAGRWLRENGCVPDLILVSPAARAVATADLLCGELTHRPEMRSVDDLYGASPDDVVALLAETDQTVGSVLVVGHNPTMADLAHSLQREPTHSATPHLPTAGLVVLRVSSEWADLAMGSAELAPQHVPRG